MEEDLTGTRSTLRDILVLHVAPHLEQGGAERLLHLIASSDVPGWRHHVALMQEKTFYDPRPLNLSSLGLDLSAKGLSFARIPSAVTELRKLARRLRPDVIQGWIYYGDIMAAALADLPAPIVWSIHNSTLPGWHEKPMLRIADRLLAVTSHYAPDWIIYCADAARVRHERAGYHTGIGMVIPNGVDTSVFRPDPLRRAAVRASLRLKSGQLAIGLFARNDPQKNLPGAFDAFASWAKGHDGRLVLAGHGMDPNDEDLRALARSRGVLDRTLFLGPVRSVEGHLNAMDAVMLASTYGEALPMILIEALCSGVPIAATRVGDVASLPAPPAALADAGDVKALAGALTAAAGRSEAPEWQTAFALSREHYSLERCLGAYQTLYRKVAAARPAAWSPA